MTDAEKAYQYFVIAIPENEEQAKAYFWARKALSRTIAPNRREAFAVRFITDDPQNNVETARNLFYIKDRETYVRGGGPAPKYQDVTLNEYTRQLIKTHAPESYMDLNDDDLSMMMAEWSFEGPDTVEGLIATLYTAAWAFSEIRAKLKEYEDTGLEPEQVNELIATERIRRETGDAADHKLDIIIKQGEEIIKQAEDRALLEEYKSLGPIGKIREQLRLDEPMKNPFDNDPYAMVWAAFKRLYPDKECRVWWDMHQNDEHDEEYGFTHFPNDGSTPSVFVYAEHPVNIQVETFAHELAHVAVGPEHEHDDIWRSAFDAIFEEYNRMGDEMFGKEPKEAREDGE